MDFIRRRGDAVDKLAKHHRFSNLLVAYEQDEDTVSAGRNYLIQRFADCHYADTSGDNVFTPAVTTSSYSTG